MNNDNKNNRKNQETNIYILNKVDGIREDLSTVELVIANNYKDIAKLKAVK